MTRDAFTRTTSWGECRHTAFVSFHSRHNGITQYTLARCQASSTRFNSLPPKELTDGGLTGRACDGTEIAGEGRVQYSGAHVCAAAVRCDSRAFVQACGVDSHSFDVGGPTAALTPRMGNGVVGSARNGARTFGRHVDSESCDWTPLPRLRWRASPRRRRL